MRTRDEAVSCKRGAIHLHVCPACGFIYNAAFDARLTDYSDGYESTQAHSGTFDAFQRQLVTTLADCHGFVGRRIVEIGCGHGEFLRALCEEGHNHGVGFDTACDEELAERREDNWSVRFVRGMYSDATADGQADAVCCRMTLDHLSDVSALVRLARRGMGGRPEATAFFQVPDAERVMRKVAFWDVYYEHCSYFSARSLTHLFALSGFDVNALWREYGDQYLFIVASPATSQKPATPDDGKEIVELARRFAREQAIRRDAWLACIAQWSAERKRVVVWGGASKTVSFLHALGHAPGIECVVDINPRKAHTFVPGAGHEIVGPSDLRRIRPDIVILMNPVYAGEIRRELRDLELTSALVSLEHPWTAAATTPP